MQKQVMVTISGIQTAQMEEQDSIEMVHIGEYFKRNQTHYILFDELMEGVSSPIKNRIKIKKNCVEVQKKGVITSHLIFEEGKNNTSNYTVPYGSFLMENRTSRVEIKEEENKIEAAASYQLYMNGEYSADCYIRIKIESKDNFRLLQ